MAPGGGNLSAVLKKTDHLVLEDTPIPQPGKNEVQLLMQAVGICGSDVHYWKKGAIGDFVLKAPMILGHESSGVVSALGEGVTHLKVGSDVVATSNEECLIVAEKGALCLRVTHTSLWKCKKRENCSEYSGDRVAIEPGVPCRLCGFCKEGRYNLCPDMVFCATPPYDGSLRRYYCHAADFCYKLPDHVTFEEGALLEPLSVGVHACKRAGVRLGHSVLVCGAGPVGLLCMLTAKAMGAAVIGITDVAENRLELAKKLGAHHAFKVGAKDEKETAKEIHSTMGCQPDVTIECSGAPSSINTGIFSTKPGGVLVIVGLGPSEVKMPIVDALFREVDIRGIFRYVNCYPTALSMIATGKVDAKPLITHHFPLSKTLEAFETVRTGAGGAVKVIIHCNE